MSSTTDGHKSVRECTSSTTDVHKSLISKISFSVTVSIIVELCSKTRHDNKTFVVNDLVLRFCNI